MWLTSSSIGRKFVMALTGAFLILFVTFHVLMNGVALFWPAAYNDVCEFLGANWYALIGSAILAGGFVIHILLALWLTYENRRARGGDRYDVTSRPKQVEWSSKNMLVLGIVIVCFLAVHMYQFWAKMQLAEVLHIDGDFPPAAGTLFIHQAFSCPVTLIIYLIGFGALWLHLTHGLWSMFQSCGCNNGIWMNRLKTIGNAWATIVVLLFVVEAVVFTVNAKKDNYLNCPALQEQYLEMAQDGEYELDIMETHWGGEAGLCCGDETAVCNCEEECAGGYCNANGCTTSNCEGHCYECETDGSEETQISENLHF